jgi:2-methylcitrate dehydratase PrpD
MHENQTALLINQLTDIWNGSPNKKQKDIITSCRLILLDSVAVIINGLFNQGVRHLEEQFGTIAAGDLWFPGLRQKQSLHGLISVLSAAATWDELIEGQAKAHGRPALHTVPLCISLGISQKLSLGQILLAMLHGYEVGARFGEAYAVPQGEHVDGTWGTIAATVSACSLLKATPEQTTGAVNAALCQMSRSLFAPVKAGSKSRLLYSGLAASRGLDLAIASIADFHGPNALIDLSVDQSKRWPNDLKLDIRDPLSIQQSYIKLLPGARHLHYCMEAALTWRREHGHDTGKHLNDNELPQSIHIETYEEAAKYCGLAKPINRIQAQFSLQYATCIALLTGETSGKIFCDDTLNLASVQRLLERTQLSSAASKPGRWAEITVIGKDGTTSTTVSSNLKGDPGNPLSQNDRINKARALIGEHLGKQQTDLLIKHCLEAPFNQGLVPQSINKD